MSEALVNGLAGAGGGIIAQILTYPLQAVNTRQQTERKAKSVDVESKSSDDSFQTKRLGTLQELCKVVDQEGWGGLFRGLTPSLVGTAASQGVYYYFYQLFKDEAESLAKRRQKNGTGDGSVGIFSSLIVAALAGCLNVLLTNPIWVVVTRMQTHSQVQRKVVKVKVEEAVSEPQTSPQSSSSDHISTYGTSVAMQDLYNEAGLLGFWKGVFPTLIMVSNPSIQFMLYETMLKQVRLKRASNKHGLTNITALEVFLLGAIAKLGATIATYPLLVVKSRLQAKQEIGGDKSHQYSGTLDAVLKMIQFEGISGFYKGMGTKILQSVFAAAVLFMVKEELVKSVRILVTKRKAVVRRIQNMPKAIMVK